MHASYGKNSDLSEESLHDDDMNDIELSQLSHDDDGDGSAEPRIQVARNKLEQTYTFCVSLKPIFCHIVSMLLVTFSQMMVSASLYIIVPLHVRDTLQGGEILTGLIFMNYGFAYYAFTLFACLFANYYGSTAMLLTSSLLAALGLLFMIIFQDYFVWLMMLFVEGIASSLFATGTVNFITDNISICLRQQFELILATFGKLAMLCGYLFAGHLITYYSIEAAVAMCMTACLCSIVFICVFTIPPKYNHDSSLVFNDSHQKISPRHESPSHHEERRVITKASITAWYQSYKQLSLRQRFSPFAWISLHRQDKNAWNAELDDAREHTPVYGIDDELNTLQVFKQNASTLLSLFIFSWSLLSTRCVRLLIITFQCMHVEQLTAIDIGYINAISFLPEFCLCYLAQFILYRYGRRYTLIPSFLLFIIALFVLPYCNDKQSLLAISIIFGIANGFSFGLIHKVAIDCAPTQYRDKFMTLYQQYLTNTAYIFAPIFVTLLIEASNVKLAAMCSAVIVIISLFWSWCIMTDPRKTGKRYEQLEFEKSYVGPHDEPSVIQPPDQNGYSMHIKNGNDKAGNNEDATHIGYKIELHSIDTEVHDESMVEKNEDEQQQQQQQQLENQSSDTDEDNTKELDIEENEADDYAEQIAQRDIANIDLKDVMYAEHSMQHQHTRFEIGNYDEEEDEESINLNLSSTDDDED